VKAHYGKNRPIVGNGGFSFLELLIVITVISLLIAVALNRFNRLLVDVERTSVEQDLGALRSAIGMQVAGHFLAGNMVGLQQLVNSNPMDLLAEKPRSYIGAVSHRDAGEVEKGSWYFDTDDKALIYLVVHQDYFASELKPARARFRIYPVYSEKKQGAGTKSYLSGLSLRPIEPYHWRKTSD